MAKQHITKYHDIKGRLGEKERIAIKQILKDHTLHDNDNNRV